VRSLAPGEFGFFYEYFFEARIAEPVEIEVVLTVAIYGFTPARPLLNPPTKATKGDTTVDDFSHL
jgi:hypothetical protein